MERRTDLLISIHAPLTGSDPAGQAVYHITGDFNPRSPYGERLHVKPIQISDGDFNPRSPYGERLLLSGTPTGGKYDFNPRSPYGERPQAVYPSPVKKYFNPRSPYGERRI